MQHVTHIALSHGYTHVYFNPSFFFLTIDRTHFGKLINNGISSSHNFPSTSTLTANTNNELCTE